MKKYLMIGLAALAFASCSKNDFVTTTQADIDKAKYDQAFMNYIGGRPASNQDWGFGTGTRAFTRATDLLKSQFTLPKFRDKDDITEPTWPGLPTTINGKTILTESSDVTKNVEYAKSVTSWSSGKTVYIDENFNWTDGNQSDLVIYVVGNVSYFSGISANGSGTTFIVTKGSTLKLGPSAKYMKIYLCEGATLDVSKEFVDINYGVWPNTATEQTRSGDFSLGTDAAIYMSTGSTLTAGGLFVQNSTIINEGGTIDTNTLHLEKSSVYNKGGIVDVDGKFYAQGTSNQNENVEFLLADGCSLDANEIEMDDYCTLWAEGNVTADNTITAKNQLVKFYIAQGKKMKAKDLNLINNSDLLVNDGTVEITNGSITLQNSGAEIVNNADMSCASFSMAAGAMMFNVGNMTMTGKTFINNSNSGWQNEGEWECGSLEITGDDKTAGNVFNNCRLTVNGQFDLNRGSFILDSNAGVVCESFRIDDTSGFYFGNKSVLKINGTLTTSIVNPEYGFFTYGSEYAVVQANGIETTTNDPQSINYYGNLLVAINPHLSADYYTAESTVKFTKDGQNIATISPSKCNPGYVGKDDPDPTCDLRIIAEDLSATQASDFDFNDVVLDVTFAKNGNPAKVMLVAAGGTLELKVGSTNGADGVEVHDALLGAENAKKGSLYKMVSPGGDVWPVDAVDITNYLSDKNITNAADANTKIRIEVNKNGEWQLLTAPKGEPACKLAVDDTFQILRERASIKGEYTLFVDWATTNAPNLSEWWKLYPTE